MAGFDSTADKTVQRVDENPYIAIVIRENGLRSTHTEVKHNKDGKLRSATLKVAWVPTIRVHTRSGLDS